MVCGRSARIRLLVTPWLLKEREGSRHSGLGFWSGEVGEDEQQQEEREREKRSCSVSLIYCCASHRAQHPYQVGLRRCDLS